MDDLVAAGSAAYVASPEFKAWHHELVFVTLSETLDRFLRLNRDATVATLCAVLDSVGGGMPDPDILLGRVREDARFWAETATQAELEAYLGFGLQAIERRAFAIAARKRLLVSLWHSLSAQDHRAFLRSVDPAGKFSPAVAQKVQVVAPQARA